MRIEAVTAYAFGPLAGETLTFAPGMTVVCGDNESAKSTWHAAVLAAVCGRRRRAGRASRDEQRFAELHRPWAGDRWLVGGVLVLDDGRRIELRHDLDGRVDCRATDLATGRDVSAEVMVGGAPDGSRWVGLDRRSFASTAWVRQARLLSVLDDAEALQEHLQRAASTAGTDATAAAALDRLEVFQREHVGPDRAGSTRPLRAAKERVARALVVQEQAVAERTSHLRLIGEATERRHIADAARHELALHEAAEAHRVAAALQARPTRARVLHEVCGAAAPTDAAGAETLAAEVAAAVQAWRDRPQLPELSEPPGRSRRGEESPSPVDALRAGADVAAATRRLSRCEAVSRRRPPVLAAGLAIALLGVLLLVAGRPLGALGAVLGLATIVAALRWVGGSAADVRAAREQLMAAQRRLARYDAETTVRAAVSAAAAEAVLAAAAACHLPADDPGRAAAALRVWLRDRLAAAERLDAVRRDQAELQALLSGRSPDDLAVEARRAARAAADRAHGLDRSVVCALAAADPGARLPTLREQAAGAAAAGEQIAGRLRERAACGADVAAAEEELAAAEEELARVRELDETLTLTRRFLQAAQERVHRDLAPVLAQRLRGWLPQVTVGRYLRAAVDPATLRVTVCGPGRCWQPADKLSHGTAEQVYLLLRVALAGYLSGGRSCPLLLDEVTVQADSRRTEQVLRLLHGLSARQQVILFSQEEQVARWAAGHLHEPRDLVRWLPVVDPG